MRISAQSLSDFGTDFAACNRRQDGRALKLTSSENGSSWMVIRGGSIGETGHVGYSSTRCGEGKYRLDGDTVIVHLLQNGSEMQRMTITSLTADELEVNTAKYGLIKYRRIK